MRRFLLSFFSVLSVIVFFTLCYYLSYVSISGRLEEEKQQQNIDTQKLMLSEDKQNRLPSMSPEVLQSAEVSYEDAIITSDTVCVYDVVDMSTGETLRYEANPGADIVGLSRMQLTQKLNNHMENLPLSEYEAGLIACEIVSFSPKQVIIQKIYDSNKVQYKYVVSIKNEEVIVYYSDYKTIYEYTGISTVGLSKELCLALTEGVQISDLEQLYDYLSGITS